MKKTFWVLLFSIFYFLFSRNASAAVLYSQAANQDVYEGQTFIVDWFLDTEDKPINSLDLIMNFSAETLEAIEVGPGNSLVNLWIKNPAADNEKGILRLTGGIANGLDSKQIPIFHSVFKAKKSGAASITLNPASVVLLNDGLGSSDQLKFKNEVFNVYPKEFIPIVIESPTHPDQNTWYNNRDVEIKFPPKAGEDYSFSFSSNIEIIPDDTVDEVSEKLSYPGRPDGIYYFKLNSKVGPSNWKEAGVYRVQIDSTAPEQFEPLIASDASVLGGKPFVSFSTLDKTSGISHYTIKVGLFRKTENATSPYELHKPWIGDDVVVTAWDLAGNSRQETVKWKGLISILEFKWLLILLGFLILIVHFYIRNQIRKSPKIK